MLTSPVAATSGVQLTIAERPAPSGVDLFGRFEVGLDVTPQPVNPFDPAEMTVQLVDLLDQLDHKVFDLKKPKLLCLPVDRNGEGVANTVDRLVGYPIRIPRGEPRHVRVSGIHLNDRDYGPEVVTTIKEEFLLVPAQNDTPVSASGS